MAIPVISTTTSILGYRRGQPFEYQMQATNSPTAWTATGLPTGLTLDNAGLISGAALYAGVYLGSITASNASGVSAPLNVAFGIEESGYNDGLGIEVNIDLLTSTVTVPGGAGLADTPVFFMKRKDILFLDIGFLKGEVLQEMNVTNLILQLREFDGESPVLTTTGAVEIVGPADRPRYRIVVDLSDSVLSDKLNEYESDYTTSFNALAEFEWHVGYAAPEALANTLIRSTRTFRVEVARDFIPN